MGTSSPWSHNPLILLPITTTFRALLRPSTIRMKRKGERGLPCLIPWEGANIAEGDPLMIIEKKVEEVRDIIHLIHQGEKPKVNTTCWMNF
jgi:hypothetical protein